MSQSINDMTAHLKATVSHLSGFADKFKELSENARKNMTDDQKKDAAILSKELEATAAINKAVEALKNIKL